MIGTISLTTFSDHTLVNNLINEEDYILLFLKKRKTYLVKVESGKLFHTHKGFIPFDDLIGKPYGSSVISNLSIEFTVLKPSLTDFIMKSVRRTQIMYPKDIALMIMFGGLTSGSLVVEAGTGTGALTTALASSIQPQGKVFSYEVRGEFLDTAKKNLTRAGVNNYVELKNQDITEGIDEVNMDSVILDLATPWLVVSHAYRVLKPCATIVSFSPTIDQVVKMSEALIEHSFIDITTIECLMREMQVHRGKTRPQTLMVGHTGYITFARKKLISE